MRDLRCAIACAYAAYTCVRAAARTPHVRAGVRALARATTAPFGARPLPPLVPPTPPPECTRERVLTPTPKLRAGKREWLTRGPRVTPRRRFVAPPRDYERRSRLVTSRVTSRPPHTDAKDATSFARIGRRQARARDEARVSRVTQLDFSAADLARR